NKTGVTLRQPCQAGAPAAGAWAGTNGTPFAHRFSLQRMSSVHARRVGVRIGTRTRRAAIQRRCHMPAASTQSSAFTLTLNEEERTLLSSFLEHALRD